jgi:hypothetical protein
MVFISYFHIQRRGAGFLVISRDAIVNRRSCRKQEEHLVWSERTYLRGCI